MNMHTFKRCSEKRFNQMLDMLPPLAWTSKGFLVGEAWGDRTCAVTGNLRPTFKAMICRWDQEGMSYFESTMGLTVAEWRALDIYSIAIETSGDS
jgi:hypothetical protein